MTTETQRLEAGIYRMHFSGKASIEAMMQQQLDVIEEARTHGDPGVVMLLEFQDDAQMPVNLQGYKQVTQRAGDDVIALYTINAPITMDLLMPILQSYLGVKIIKSPSLDQALQEARKVLKGHG